MLGLLFDLIPSQRQEMFREPLKSGGRLASDGLERQRVDSSSLIRFRSSSWLNGFRSMVASSITLRAL